MAQTQRLAGHCHCRNVSIELVTSKPASAFSPRECSCEFCTMHHASWVADPLGSAAIRYEDGALVGKYRFGHATADFIVCRQCGVVVASLCEIEGRLRAVVNVRTLPPGTFSAEPIHTDHDGESVEGRLARRARNWIGTVSFEPLGSEASSESTRSR